jgi:ferrochelatase
VEGLEVGHEKVYTAFQSRFGRNWLSPFTDKILINMARKGKKNILVISPAFVADCLETSIEIGHDYNRLFRDAGGEVLTLVPSMNSDPEWAEFLAGLSTSSLENVIHLADGFGPG